MSQRNRERNNNTKAVAPLCVSFSPSFFFFFNCRVFLRCNQPIRTNFLPDRQAQSTLCFLFLSVGAFFFLLLLTSVPHHQLSCLIVTFSLCVRVGLLTPLNSFFVLLFFYQSVWIQPEGRNASADWIEAPGSLNQLRSSYAYIVFIYIYIYTSCCKAFAIRPAAEIANDSFDRPFNSMVRASRSLAIRRNIEMLLASQTTEKSSQRSVSIPTVRQKRSSCSTCQSS